jgi:hypothetical protein
MPVLDWILRAGEVENFRIKCEYIILLVILIWKGDCPSFQKCHPFSEMDRIISFINVILLRFLKFLLGFIKGYLFRSL